MMAENVRKEKSGKGKSKRAHAKVFVADPSISWHRMARGNVLGAPERRRRKPDGEDVMHNRMTRAWLIATILMGVAVLVSAAVSATDVDTSASGQGAANGRVGWMKLAATPPMGWNSWNKFACNVSETLIREMADAMVSNGMKDAGYHYVVIDDCWQVSRDASGNIVPDAKRFPSGMKALADYVHSKGLKFGVYSDAGAKTCQGRPGSNGYEVEDAPAIRELGRRLPEVRLVQHGRRRSEDRLSDDA